MAHSEAYENKDTPLGEVFDAMDDDDCIDDWLAELGECIFELEDD